MMNILDTLQYMKPDIRVVIWEDNATLSEFDVEIIDNGIDYKIIYHSEETFRPTITEILAVDQTAVANFINQQEETGKTLTLEQIQEQINNLQQQLAALTG